MNTELNSGTTATPGQESVSIADLNLADYRAQRDGKPAVVEAETPTNEDPNAEGSEAAGEGESETEGKQEKERPAKKGGFQRKLESKDREIAQLRAQLAQGAGKPGDEAAAAAAPAATTAAASDGFSKPKPTMDAFDSIEEFTEALTDWKADEREHRKTAELETKKVLDGWNNQQGEARKAHSDYDEVLDSVSDVAIPQAHQRLFLESEAGAEIAYQLASDPKELKKFSALSPMAAARYFGKLEAQFSQLPSSSSRLSNAPRPISPVGRGSAGTAAISDVSKLPLSAYRELRAAGRIR